MGSLFDFDINGKQSKALFALWPLLAYERIFKRLEMTVDTFMESVDVPAIRAAVSRPDVVPVWSLWWAAQQGKEHKPNWWRAGRHHADNCREQSPGVEVGQ